MCKKKRIKFGNYIISGHFYKLIYNDFGNNRSSESEIRIFIE